MDSQRQGHFEGFPQKRIAIIFLKNVKFYRFQHLYV